MLTTTIEKSVSSKENEDVHAKLQGHDAISERVKMQSIKPALNKIDLYTSVLGLALVVCFLLVTLKDQNMIMTEGLKALSIAGILNLLRVFSNSKF